jgi:hypothetical protein
METDKTESKVRQWALRKDGDTITVQDVVELVFAQDDDANERHRENVKIAEAMDKRLAKLEKEHAERGAVCPYVLTIQPTIPMTESDVDSWWARHVSGSVSRFVWLLLGGLVVAFVTWLTNR